MIETLYKEVFGAEAQPGSEALKDFTRDLVALPENIYYAVYHYYVLNESKESIAAHLNVPLHMTDRWLNSGISLLKVTCNDHLQPRNDHSL